MSDYIAPVDYDEKEVNAFTTKEDIEGLEEVVSAALTDLDSRLPQKYWGQQLPEGGTEITGDMSGVTSIRMPLSAASHDARFLIETDNDYRLIVKTEYNNEVIPDPNEQFVIGTGGYIKSPHMHTSALTISADWYTVDGGSYYISPFRPTFFGFPLTGQQTFQLAVGGSRGNTMTITYHYYWVFDTGDTAPTITWPSEITSWYGGSVPTIRANKHYEVSVLGNYDNGSSLVGVIMEV